MASRFLSWVFACWFLVATSFSQSGTFTYQGQLQQNGSPVTNASQAISFQLFDALTGGSQIGGTLLLMVNVQNGLFTAPLDFGAGAFNGQRRWLQVRVSGTSLTPRQEVTAVPYALWSAGPWQTSGTTLSYTTGDVGIGTDDPLTRLDVRGGDYTIHAENVRPYGFAVTGVASHVGSIGGYFWGGGSGVEGGTDDSLGAGVAGRNFAIAGPAYGVYGESRSPDGWGGYFRSNDANSTAGGVYGEANSLQGWGGFFVGRGYFSGNVGIGTTTPIAPLHVDAATLQTVFVENSNPYGNAIQGVTTGSGAGVLGYVLGTFGDGVRGMAAADTGATNGVWGESASASGCGVYGLASATSGTNIGVWGESASASGYGVVGINNSDGWAGFFRGRVVFMGKLGIGIANPSGPLHIRTPSSPPGALPQDENGLLLGSAETNTYKWIQSYGGPLALNPVGNGVAVNGTYPGANQLYVNGTFSATVKNFTIDHPLDPENKLLRHSCVESDQMMTAYKGRITTDANGEVWVILPDYFQALNTDYEYHLTCIGTFAQAIVGREIEGNRFLIKTDKPNVTVSWQVFGVRQDAYARAHPLIVEEAKSVIRTEDPGQAGNQSPALLAK